MDRASATLVTLEKIVRELFLARTIARIPLALLEEFVCLEFANAWLASKARIAEHRAAPVHHQATMHMPTPMLMLIPMPIHSLNSSRLLNFRLEVLTMTIATIVE